MEPIWAKVKTGASLRHVTTCIVTVTDIPRTESDKITEFAVRFIVHDRDVKNKQARVNPEELELFATFRRYRNDRAAAKFLTRYKL